MIMKNLQTFEDFLNESYYNTELILEAFNSSILQDLTQNKKGGLGKEFYDTLSKMGVASSEITNLDILTIEPKDAEKYTKANPNAVLIYFSREEKENPFTSDYWYKKIQGNTVLAVVKGKLYMGLDYDRWASKKPGKAVYKLVAGGGGKSLGMSDKSNSKYGSGLNTLKKMAEVTDVVYVIDLNTIPSSVALRTERSESKKGAAAFIDDKQFKQENMSRYESILRDRAANDDIDKIVKEAIDKLTDQIKAGLGSGKKGSYGDLLIGESPKGRPVTMADATRLMERILSTYGTYAQYIDSAKTSKERHGHEDSYYERESKSKAKEIKDNSNKIDTLNYAW